MNSKRPIVWFEVYVNDMKRAQKFYETVLDIKLEQLSDPNDNAVQMKSFPGDMESYGANGALVKMEGFNGGANSTIIYFGSEDCLTDERRVEQAGGTLFKPKTAIGDYGFISLFYDTEGNMIGLHSMN